MASYKLRGFLVSIFFISILFLVSCGTVEKIHEPGIDDPVAHFPRMDVGDSWEFQTVNRGARSKFSEKVIKVKPDGSFVVEHITEKGETKHFTVPNFEKDNTTKTYTKFPLFVGKTWSFLETGTSVKGHINSYILRYRVSNYGPIKVAGDEFNAFKIVMKNSLTSGVRSFYQYYWYVPELKRVVKHKFGPGYSNEDNYEKTLIKYNFIVKE